MLQLPRVQYSGERPLQHIPHALNQGNGGAAYFYQVDLDMKLQFQREVITSSEEMALPVTTRFIPSVIVLSIALLIFGCRRLLVRLIPTLRIEVASIIKEELWGVLFQSLVGSWPMLE